MLKTTFNFQMSKTDEEYNDVKSVRVDVTTDDIDTIISNFQDFLNACGRKVNISYIESVGLDYFSTDSIDSMYVDDYVKGIF